MEGNLIEQGVELMLFGMGTVVVFLTLLVLVTSAMSVLVQRYLPPPPEPAATAPARGVDGRTLAIITAAIKQHRDKKDTGKSL